MELVEGNLLSVERAGYRVVGHFTLPDFNGGTIISIR